jgi:small subunit ribosomal protein S1
MPDPNIPESQTSPEPAESSFRDLLSEFEQTHKHRTEEGGSGRIGAVVAISAESVFFDIGLKTEGILPLTALQDAGQEANVGDKLPVSITGRDPEGYYELSLGRIERPTDWPALEKAFAEKAIIMGRVTGVTKGGLSVDVGVRAFMPASRTGIRDAAEMEKLVGQEIRCRITKLDVTDEDVVVDARAIAEEDERAQKVRRYSELKEGETVHGTVRSLTDYGAFVDIGEMDALLHVSDISWGRIGKAADVLSVGQEVDAKILKVDAEKQRISLSMKQLQPDPWDLVAEKYIVGERVRGVVTRLADFGAFVEMEPGLDGLIHISEMSWARKVRKPGDILKVGDVVEAVILGVNPGERRIALGLKQALGDPWAEVAQKFPVGTVVSGPISSITKFGAFVQVAEGVEGMIHVIDISAEKRINHPQDVLKAGQTIKAQVLEIDKERRRLKLGIKQMTPSSLEEYLAEHKAGDLVSGRITGISGNVARVELGEGVQGTYVISAEKPKEEPSVEGSGNLSSMTSLLQARWKSGAASSSSKRETVSTGQILSFRITKLDAGAKTIELEQAAG